MTISSTFTELFKRTFSDMMKDVATSIPGHVLAFDTTTQRAQIQIGIVRIDVNGKTFIPPPLIEVPVYFAGGSNYLMEHQIDPLDEGFIMFSQRCIDAWNTTGGVAQNPILRFHDYSDAVFFPGLRSEPNAIESFENNGIRLRDKNADNYIWLKNDGSVTIKSTDFNVESPTFTHNGTNVGDDHKHAAGTYNISGTPVVDNSGNPL